MSPKHFLACRHNFHKEIFYSGIAFGTISRTKRGVYMPLQALYKKEFESERSKSSTS